ncbi:hypothetical protein BJX76DRAFT_336062 [Aspergillus varians]
MGGWLDSTSLLLIPPYQLSAPLFLPCISVSLVCSLTKPRCIPQWNINRSISSLTKPFMPGLRMSTVLARVASLLSMSAMTSSRGLALFTLVLEPALGQATAF